LEKRPLGDSGLDVSIICLGTMTWGEQNTEVEAHHQLDYALEHGVNFIDTAEMYPVPPRAETYTRTEEYIGRWGKLRTERDKIVLATKVVGPAEMCAHIRDGKPRLDRKNIMAALEASLSRLQTDYVDLYQLHWPDRHTNFFGQRGYTPTDDVGTIPIEETLEVLNDIQRTGKVKTFGLSNETPWGTMQYLSLAEKDQWPRVVSVQNPYNLLNRTYEVGMAEVSYRERVGLLAYSPLGFGVLSGKYLNGQFPEGARLTRWNRFGRYTSPNAERATERYVKLAREHGLDPAQMALAFVNSRPFVTSNIIGATSMEQLKMNIASHDLVLSDELLKQIEEIHEDNPNPCP
jgi:aryl-alcohol dehydrogenase-like predicted oxidoreductase